MSSASDSFNRQLSKVGLETLQKRIVSAYLELSNESIATLKEICSNAEHAAEVKEVLYIACLQKLSRDDLNKERELRRKAGGLRTALNEVLDMYERRQNEQEVLLANGGIKEPLTTALLSMPKLEKISFIARPTRKAEPSPANCEPAYRWTSEAFNAEISWRDHSRESTYHELKHISFQDWLRNSLWREARYYPRARQQYDNPLSLMEPLATVPIADGPRSIKLSLSVPLWCLDDRWDDFVTERPLVVQSAMQHITAVKLVPSPSGDDRDRTASDEDRTLAARWVGFLSHAHRLKSLNLSGGGKISNLLLSSLLTESGSSDPGWPELSSLHLLVWDQWHEQGPHQSMVMMPRFDLIDTIITKFLQRRGRTIKEIHFEDTLGANANSPGWSSASTLAQSLEQIKQLPNLETANITVRSCPNADWLGNHNDRSRARNEPNWKDADRAVEQGTELGQLARKLSVEPREWAMEWNDEQQMEMFGYLEDDDFLGKDHLHFEYDFGPYVLHKDESSECGVAQSSE